MDKDKKKLAAIAGVMAYLETESTIVNTIDKPTINPSNWSSWGRQQTMLHRDLTQRRFIKRNK